MILTSDTILHNMLWTNLIVGTHLIIASVIGDHIHHLISIGIDTNFGMIGHLTIHSLIMDGDIIVGDGILTIMDGIVGIDLIDHGMDIGIVGTMGHGVIQAIM